MYANGRSQTSLKNIPLGFIRLRNRATGNLPIGVYTRDVMSSQTQIHDSRANGTKSHRPKTPEGTARSAQNSVRHGILADSLLLDEESSDRFQSLSQSFQCIFSPVDEFETVCVEIMIAARWRCMRVWAVEPAGLQHAVKSQPDEGSKGSTRASIAVRSQFEGSNERDVLARYETRYAIFRCLRPIVEVSSSERRALRQSPRSPST